MASDITAENTRLYNAIIPPISGSCSYELSTDWGSRVAVMSVRVRGLSGMGTINGTTITFPDGYFIELPIVECSYFQNIPQLFPWQPCFLPYDGNAVIVGTSGITIAAGGKVISWSAKGI